MSGDAYYILENFIGNIAVNFKRQEFMQENKNSKQPTLYRTCIQWVKALPGQIILGIIVVLVSSAAIAICTNAWSHRLVGKWHATIDYEMFFGRHISNYGNAKIVSEGEVYIVMGDMGQYQGLIILDISVKPESFSEQKKFVTLVLRFNELSRGDSPNRYRGTVSVLTRQPDLRIINDFFIKEIKLKPEELSVPTMYDVSWELESSGRGVGMFSGTAGDGKKTTEGKLVLQK